MCEGRQGSVGPKAELEKDGCRHCPGELTVPGQGGVGVPQMTGEIASSVRMQ